MGAMVHGPRVTLCGRRSGGDCAPAQYGSWECEALRSAAVRTPAGSGMLLSVHEVLQLSQLQEQSLLGRAEALRAWFCGRALLHGTYAKQRACRAARAPDACGRCQCAVHARR